MSDPSTAFEHHFRDALARAGGVEPGVDLVQVVLVDASRWIDLLDSAFGLLDPLERARAEAFRFADGRAHYVLAHAAWRVLLATCLGGAADGVDVSREDAGRPLLPGYPGWETSLSRSGPWAALVVARCPGVGVDIERSPARQPLDEVMATVGAATELALLAAMPVSERPLAMLQLWTRKEAVLKAFGTGLTVDPAAIDTTLPRVPDPRGLQPPCYVRDLKTPDGLIGSLALIGDGRPVRALVLGH